MLIVSKTDSGSANLADKIHILGVVLGEKGITKAPSVLVTRYAAQGVFLAVEDKSSLRIDLKSTAAKAVAYVVKNFLAFNDLYFTAVKVRITASVPEVNVLDLKGYLSLGALDLLEFVFFLVVDCVNELLRGSKILYVSLNLNGCVSTVYCGCDLDSGSSVVVKVEMRLVYTDKVDVTVDTAVECKVSHLRIYSLVDGVFNYNCDLGVLCESLSDVYSPGGVTAVVMSELVAVNVEVCGCVCSAELDVVKVCFGKLCALECLSVKAIAAEVVVAAVLTVDCVPGVGKVYLLAILAGYVSTILYKQPVLVYVEYFSDGFSPLFNTKIPETASDGIFLSDAISPVITQQICELRDPQSSFQESFCRCCKREQHR